MSPLTGKVAIMTGASNVTNPYDNLDFLSQRRAPVNVLPGTLSSCSTRIGLTSTPTSSPATVHGIFVHDVCIDSPCTTSAVLGCQGWRRAYETRYAALRAWSIGSAGSMPAGNAAGRKSSARSVASLSGTTAVISRTPIPMVWR